MLTVPLERLRPFNIWFSNLSYKTMYRHCKRRLINCIEKNIKIRLKNYLSFKQADSSISFTLKGEMLSAHGVLMKYI